MANNNEAVVVPHGQTVSGSVAPATADDPRRLYTLPNGYRGSTPLYAYQCLGAVLLETKERQILADAPGLGKTVQVLYAHCDLYTAGKSKKLIVLCKASYARTWVKQIAEHCNNNLRVQMFAGMDPQDREVWRDDADVYLMSYALLSRSMHRGCLTPDSDAARMLKVLQKHECTLAIDESHVVGNPDANVTKIVLDAAPFSRYTFPMTGTLVPDKVSSVWAQVRLIDPTEKHMPESYAEFCKRYTKRVLRKYNGAYVDKEVGGRRLPELHKRIRPLHVRRVNPIELPPTVEVPHELSAGRHAKALQDKLAVLLSRMESLQSTGKFSSALMDDSVGKLMHDIRMLSAAPDGAKMELFFDRHDDLGGQVVVWCYHRDVADAWGKTLGNKARVAHGGKTNKVRNQVVTDFEQGKFDVLVATMDSMRESHTLTNARHAFYAQLDWYLLNWEQSIKRVSGRVTQTGTCVIDVPLMDLSIDAYAWQVLHNKKEDADTVMDGGGASGSGFTAFGLMTHIKNILGK